MYDPYHLPNNKLQPSPKSYFLTPKVTKSLNFDPKTSKSGQFTSGSPFNFFFYFWAFRRKIKKKTNI